MLWTVVGGGNKIVDLLIRNLTFSLECFLEDYIDRNKKFNEWTKVAETLQSEIAQVASVTFSGLQSKQSSSIRKHQKRHIGIFSNSEKCLWLLHAQVNDHSPNSLHSPLKLIVLQSGLRTVMLSLFLRSFIQRLLVLLTNCQKQEMGKFLEGLCLI